MAWWSSTLKKLQRYILLEIYKLKSNNFKENHKLKVILLEIYKIKSNNFKENHKFSKGCIKYRD